MDFQKELNFPTLAPLRTLFSSSKCSLCILIFMVLCHMRTFSFSCVVYTEHAPTALSSFLFTFVPVCLLIPCIALLLFMLCMMSTFPNLCTCISEIWDLRTCKEWTDYSIMYTALLQFQNTFIK